MTKFEFIHRLNSKLYLLKESERLDIINEYTGHIDMKINEGKTEAQAIEDFGNIDDLANEILAAYHIDSTKLQNKTLDIYVKEAIDYMIKVAESILSLSTAQLAGVFVEFVVLLVIIYFMRYPTDLCSSIFAELFSWLPYTIYHIASNLCRFVTYMVYILLGFMFIGRFIRERIINAPFAVSQPQTVTAYEKAECVASELKEKQVKTQIAIKNTAGKTKRMFKGMFIGTGDTVKRMAESTGDFVTNLAIISLKIMIFLFLWLPCAGLTVSAVVCTVIAIMVYLTTGIGFVGVCIAGAGCCLMGTAATLWLTGVMTGGKSENA